MGSAIDETRAADLIGAARRQLYFLHVSPDGDSIGSTLAVVRTLRAAGYEAWAVGVDPVPRIYHFLAGWDTLFVPWEQVTGDWDLGVFLDCGDRERVGAAAPVLDRCRVTLNIDHHATNTLYGDYYWVDGSAAACGEQAYRLLKQLGHPIDRDAAIALYTALVTDTGSFAFNSVTPETHRIAANLVAAGVRPYDVAQEIFENDSPERVRLMAAALGTLSLHAGGRVATVKVTQAMLAASGAQPEDVDGLVNHARAVRGVEVAALLRETEDGTVRVNLRSRRTVDVARLAQQFGGGGHARAAGCTLAAGIDTALARIVAAVTAGLEAE